MNAPLLWSLWAGFEALDDVEPDEGALSKAKDDVNGGAPATLLGRIGGLVSSEAKDLQGEEVLQAGIDWSYFLKHGWFNWEHQPGPENVLGHADKIERTTDAAGNPASRVEGVLYLHDARAKRIYDTARALKKAGTGRQLGFSIEGAVVQRDPTSPKRVLKSRVLNVAITAHPVQPDARFEPIARSLAAADAGYQNPASGGGAYAPVVPQSIDGQPSVATARLSLEDLAAALRRHFPGLDPQGALDAARNLSGAIG